MTVTVHNWITTAICDTSVTWTHFCIAPTSSNAWTNRKHKILPSNSALLNRLHQDSAFQASYLLLEEALSSRSVTVQPAVEMAGAVAARKGPK